MTISDASQSSPQRVHFEWWYDLGQPIFAAKTLLSTNRDYSTRLGTDLDDERRPKRILPVTLRLPGQDSVGTSFGPPKDWTAELHAQAIKERNGADYWAVPYEEHNAKARVSGVALKRLAFTFRGEVPADMSPEEQDEWAAVELVLEIRHSMDHWWDNVGTWLEIATGQLLGPWGHRKSIDDRRTRIPIWADGKGEECNVGGIGIREPVRILAVTPQCLQDCVALAAQEPALEWRLLRNSRALVFDFQLRRAVIDAAAAAEVAMTARIEQLIAGESNPARRKKLEAALEVPLGGKHSILSELGEPLPCKFKTDLLKVRNHVVHKAKEVKLAQAESAFQVAMEVVQLYSPLPKPPGSSHALPCCWPGSVSLLPPDSEWYYHW